MAKIVQFSVDVIEGCVYRSVLDDSGRLYLKRQGNVWEEWSSYPPGCDPNKNEEAERHVQDTPPGAVF